MTTGLGRLLRNVFFWCGLATVNILLRDGQPVVLAVSAGFVVVLLALKVAVEAFPGDIGQATSRVAAHVIFWGTGYVILLLLYSIACARLLSGKQYHAWRESGMGVVGLAGPAVVLAALRLLWWWWHRKPTPPADPPTRLKPVPKSEPDPEAERQRRSREAEQVAQQKRREDPGRRWNCSSMSTPRNSRAGSPAGCSTSTCSGTWATHERRTWWRSGASR